MIESSIYQLAISTRNPQKFHEKLMKFYIDNDIVSHMDFFNKFYFYDYFAFSKTLSPIEVSKFIQEFIIEKTKYIGSGVW